MDIDTLMFVASCVACGAVGFLVGVQTARHVIRKHAQREKDELTPIHITITRDGDGALMCIGELPEGMIAGSADPRVPQKEIKH